MQFILSHWPLAFICVAMIVAAVIDGWKLKVPNWLTFPLVLSGWVLGLLHNFGVLESTGVGGIGASLAGTVPGLRPAVSGLHHRRHGRRRRQDADGLRRLDRRLLRLRRRRRASPARCGSSSGPSAWRSIIGGVIALGMIASAASSAATCSTPGRSSAIWPAGVGNVADKAAERKPRMHLLPYGIPLCLGFVGYLILPALMQHATSGWTRQTGRINAAIPSNAAGLLQPTKFEVARPCRSK